MYKPGRGGGVPEVLGPAEVRDYGELLVQQGYIVMGVRLKGHGTSPYALQNQSWQDWYNSVEYNFKSFPFAGTSSFGKFSKYFRDFSS